MNKEVQEAVEWLRKETKAGREAWVLPPTYKENVDFVCLALEAAERELIEHRDNCSAVRERNDLAVALASSGNFPGQYQSQFVEWVKELVKEHDERVTAELKAALECVKSRIMTGGSDYHVLEGIKKELRQTPAVSLANHDLRVQAAVWKQAEEVVNRIWREFTNFGREDLEKVDNFACKVNGEFRRMAAVRHKEIEA